MLIISEYDTHPDDPADDDEDHTDSKDQIGVDKKGLDQGERTQGSSKDFKENWKRPAVITYRGRVLNIRDALLLFEATRLKILPTINRRLTTVEKSRYIRPNTVFIWNETQCGMKRWTDGKIWSPSKVHHGLFLIYKQLAKDGEQMNSLVKQSVSILTKQNQKLHLICYYKKDSAIQETPSSDPQLKDLEISPDIYPNNLLPPNKLSKTPSDSLVNNSKPVSLKRAKSLGSQSKVTNKPSPVSTTHVASTQYPVEYAAPTTGSVEVKAPVIVHQNSVNSIPDLVPNTIDTTINPEVSDYHILSQPVYSNQFIQTSQNTDYVSTNPYSRRIPGISLPPPPPPQPSHYRLSVYNCDSQTLDVLDKVFSL